jgi:selenium metabolism protein YedF
MLKEIDARGLTCPKPVIQTKKAIEELADGQVTTIVDNEIAKENVTKYAKSINLNYQVREVDGFYHIDIFKEGMELGMENLPQPKPRLGEQVILVGKDKLGEGNDQLGEVLIKGYFYTLTEMEPYPSAILFLNGAIKLTLESSPVLEHLRTLEMQGVQVLSCGTCLDYYNAKDQLAVGGVTNMYTIVEHLNKAKTVIRI